jgi:hypothetical protein
MVSNPTPTKASPIMLPKMQDVFDLPRLMTQTDFQKQAETLVPAVGISEAGTGDKTNESVSPHQDAIE